MREIYSSAHSYQSIQKEHSSNNCVKLGIFKVFFTNIEIKNDPFTDNLKFINCPNLKRTLDWGDKYCLLICNISSFTLWTRLKLLQSKM